MQVRWRGGLADQCFCRGKEGLRTWQEARLESSGVRIVGVGAGAGSKGDDEPAGLGRTGYGDGGVGFDVTSV